MSITTEFRNRHIRTVMRISCRLLFVLLFLMPDIPVSGQSPSDNYVLARKYLSADGSSSESVISYCDGLGRVVETVLQGSAPDGRDLVTLLDYGTLSRVERSWLPQPHAGGGSFVSPDLFRQSAMGSATYGGDAAPYAESFHEASSLERLERQYGAGQSWREAQKPVVTERLTNRADGVLSCRRYEVSGERGLTLKGLFPSCTLFVEKTTDEDGRCIYVFRDFLGQTVLHRRVAGGVFHDTYYVYDGYGSLRFVLPPDASSRMADTGTVWSMESDATLSRYAYCYLYDQRMRCIEKSLPDCERQVFRYDRRNNLVFSQDGALRAQGRWRFFLYDDKNRPTVSGTFLSAQAPELETVTVSSCHDGGPLEGYSSPLDLTPGLRMEKVCYYDGYSVLSLLPQAHASALAYRRDGTSDGYAEAYCIGADPSGKGKLTVEKVFDTEGVGYTVRSFYYDERKRIAQQHGTNRKGGYEHDFYRYGFTGEVLRHRHEHTTSADTLVTEYLYTYDHADRLLSTRLSYNGAEPVMIADNVYDELGRLQSVSRMENPQLMTQYAYNVRSWTTAISSPLFSQQLYYNESHNGSTPQWGGNISAMDWQAEMTPTGINPQGASLTAGKHRGYSFSYDGLSRLTQADYHENNTRSNRYDTRYTYDLMGNMLTLQRNGLHDDGEFSIIDDLTFEYEGNQVIKVTDAEPDGPYYKDAWHYRDGADAEIEREYDGNGNLTKDLDAGILRIEYNSLNLPKMIRFSDGSVFSYLYDASGNKLQSHQEIVVLPTTDPDIIIGDLIEEEEEEEEEEQPEEEEEWNEEEWEELEEMLEEDQEENHEQIDEEQEQMEDYLMTYSQEEALPETVELIITDYCGNFIYENGTLKRILFPGGYMTFINDDINQPEYHFYITDHQGNVRVVANQNGEVEQVNHYYPYGGLMGESTNSDHQPYKYNGKELDRHHGLDWYYYGARWYNGYSWMNPDPHAESYYDVTPYGYCHNNPVNKIDPTGMDGVKIIDDNNKTITIKANYYVVTSIQYYKVNGEIRTLNGYTDNDIQQMNLYNEYLNDLNLKVSSGEYEGYKITFDLQFKDGGSTLSSGMARDNDFYEGHSIGNSIQKGTHESNPQLKRFKIKENEDGTTSVVGGRTFEKKNIIMNVGYDNTDTKMNRLHEIFHTLGFNHPEGEGGSQGIMRYPPQRPTTDDALELSRSLFLPIIQKK